MSFKSVAHKRRCQELVKQGKMSEAAFKEFEAKTPAQLPERVTPKAKPKPLYPKGWKMPKWK